MAKQEEKNLDDIVLYHGSLEELQRETGSQTFRYELHKDLFWVSDLFIYDSRDSSSREAAKKIVQEAGYDGLVNASIQRDVPTRGYVQGTPLTIKIGRKFYWRIGRKAKIYNQSF